jgi:hypothetical protein
MSTLRNAHTDLTLKGKGGGSNCRPNGIERPKLWSERKGGGTCSPSKRKGDVGVVLLQLLDIGHVVDHHPGLNLRVVLQAK